MRELLVVATESVSLAIDAVALLTILIGTIEAVAGGARLMFTPAATNHARRQVWLRYARWLVAGLTFQLAADIIETAIAPDWDAVGRLAAIAAIRTFLDYFLERDVAEISNRDREALGT
jgi:uncharacterized membrane protein